MPGLLPPPGAVARYRVTRLAQGNSGPRSLTSDVTLRRKSATALTLRGVAGDPAAESTELNVQPDGTLAIPATDAEASANASLVDVIDGFNRVAEVFAGQSSIPRDGWSPTLRLPDLHGANSTVSIPVAVENANGFGFDLHGVGEITVQPQQAAAASAVARSVGRRRGGGFRGAGGFPGGGAPAPLPDALATPAHAPVTVAVSLDGRIRHGLLKLAITETRSVTVDGVPYVSVSGWTVQRTK
jgi:hypothetical protein